MTMTTEEQTDRAAQIADVIDPPKGGEVAVPEAPQADADPAPHPPLPGMPGYSEFLALAMQARILSMSGAAPKLVRGNPYIAFHVAMVGRDLGISPSAALELIDVMDTAGGIRLSLSPQLLNGQIRRLGLGSIVPVVQEVDRCVAVALQPGGHVDRRCGRTWPEHLEGCECRGINGDTEFTWEEARMAGLVGHGCEPGQHTVACGNKSSASHLRCAQGYRTYPKRMMWWRAGGYCADDWFPEAGLGLYSPEELGAVVDIDGRPIDPSTVDLPEGYAPKEPEPEELATADDIDALADRIAVLPDGAKDELRTRWLSPNDAGDPYLSTLKHLPARQLRKAKALVDHITGRAAKGEWGEWSPPAKAQPEPKAPAPPAEDEAPTMEALAEAMEALSESQRTWLQAAVAAEGLGYAKMVDPTTRAAFATLVEGAARQPATAPQMPQERPEANPDPSPPHSAEKDAGGSLVARAEALAAQVREAKAAHKPKTPPDDAQGRLA